jgi:hypothetical protein
VNSYGINHQLLNAILICINLVQEKFLICVLITTGIKSIDDIEWICSTCHSNLKSGKLPSCAKANKMTFPEKPDVLKNLIPLEEAV